jgi:hypothetical protein
LISVVSLISEINTEIESVSSESTEKYTKLSKTLKDTVEFMKSVEKKVSHTNGQIDSLHTKLNVQDGKIKKLDDNQTNILSKLESFQIDLVSVKEYVNSHSQDRYEETIPKLMLDKNVTGNEASNNSVPCDYLILSDSILRKISTKKFSPNNVTIKRYIRGGAETCCDFIKKNGCKFKPKRVIIHIGTRDVQKNGIRLEHFTNLFSEATKIWPNAKIHVLPLMNRKDVHSSRIAEANEIIVKAVSGFSQVEALHSFHPKEDMFWDNVHLNTYSGIPALVNHLQRVLEIDSRRDGSQPQMCGLDASCDKPTRTTWSERHTLNKHGPRPSGMFSQPCLSPRPITSLRSMMSPGQPRPQMPPGPPVPPMPPGPPHPLMPPMPPYFNPWQWNPYPIPCVPFDHCQNPASGRAF